MDEIVDTNVWLVASHADPGSPWKDSAQILPSDGRVVLDWLESFVRDRARKLVIDQLGKVCDEYWKKNRWPSFGARALRDKMSDVRIVDVVERADGYAEVPEDIAAVLHERTDQVFAAVALADAGNSEIVNAVDTDWSKAELVLRSHGVRVNELLPEFLDRRRE